MALTKQQKAAQLKVLKDRMARSQSIIFAQYAGLTVAGVSQLRAKLKEGQAEMMVAKKTLMQIAMKEAKLPEVSDASLEGAIACVFSYADPLSGANLTFSFAKDFPQVKLVGGIFDGKSLSAAEAQALAKIPSRQQLLGIFAAMITSPLRGFAIGLSELAKKKAEPAAAAPAAPVVAAAEPEAPATPAEPTPAAEPAPEPAAAEPTPEAPPAA
jgi:large subunit ribosomal protein L10